MVTHFFWSLSNERTKNFKKLQPLLLHASSTRKYRITRVKSFLVNKLVDNTFRHCFRLHNSSIITELTVQYRTSSLTLITIMGTNASKPMEEPREQWESKKGTKSFEVISPCSDISNPSDFNRVRYNRHTRQNELNAERFSGTGKTSSRKNPKSMKTRDYNPHDLPVAVKVRRSTSTGGNGHGDFIAPGAFYFPTKESERRVDRLAKQGFRTDHNATFDRNSSRKNIQNIRGNKGKTKSFHILARRAARKIKKRKNAMKRVAIAVGQACLEETRKKMILNKDIGINATRERYSSREFQSSRGSTDRRHPDSLRSRRRSEQMSLNDLQAKLSRHDVPLGKLKKDHADKEKNMNTRENSTSNKNHYQNQMNRVSSAALHQADAYFDRLSVSPSKNFGASPFVPDRNGIAPSNRITSILESTSKKTPKDRAGKLLMDSPIDTPVSDLFRDNDSDPHKINDTSPVSSLMRFYTKSGPMESSPTSYYSDALQTSESSKKMGIDDTSKEENQGRFSEETRDSLYTAESKSYKSINGKDLKLLSHDNHQKESDNLHSYIQSKQNQEKSRKVTKQKPKERKPKVSKLESLFRPILPALSTDDAHSVYSYDPYEIKVTESAPGAIQPTNYMALGFRNSSPQNANNASPSASVLSIDSQRRASSSSVEHMVSNQAHNNGEFLFTDDYGPVVVAQDPERPRDNAALSISTAGARSRLPQKSTQKGVAIPIKKLEKEMDDLSLESRSIKSGRRVRFSEGSIRLSATKEDETTDIEEKSIKMPYDEADSTGRTTAKINSDIYETCHNGNKENEIGRNAYSKFCAKPPSMKFHKFASNVTRVNSIDESIDLPEIESKMAEVSETISETRQTSLGSSRTARSHRSISISSGEEDERTVVSNSSIHWTKTKHGVTPFVQGKSSANPTKSPFYRYQDAKTKFNTQNRLVTKKSFETKTSPKKSPRKSPAKSPSKIVRKGSGGLVSLRIQELNTRVSEVRKLNRLRKKTTNPRLHTHNFDNTQPVRSRALINYKTNIGSANLEKSNNVMAAKFNRIPEIGDDDDSTNFSPITNQNYVFGSGKQDVEDDDASKMSEITGATIATVRQQRESRGYSMNSHSTTSSGLTNLKKQVFRTSDGTRSLASNGDSTSMSDLLQKENDASVHFNTTTISRPNATNFSSNKPTLAPPCKGTPAMKWRKLAAAAAEKDALKLSSSKPRKVLGTRSANCDNYEIYGFKD